eukprot:SAG11_NODE_2563_length_3218_cov_8.710484_2_plen_236_part_00
MRRTERAIVRERGREVRWWAAAAALAAGADHTAAIADLVVPLATTATGLALAALALAAADGLSLSVTGPANSSVFELLDPVFDAEALDDGRNLLLGHHQQPLDPAPDLELHGLLALVREQLEQRLDLPAAAAGAVTTPGAMRGRFGERSRASREAAALARERGRSPPGTSCPYKLSLQAVPTSCPHQLSRPDFARGAPYQLRVGGIDDAQRELLDHHVRREVVDAELALRQRQNS